VAYYCCPTSWLTLEMPTRGFRRVASAVGPAVTVTAPGCKAEEMSQVAVIYFEFLLQHSLEGKERQCTVGGPQFSVFGLWREHRPAENSKTLRKLPS
jgi:hypothetical protein